MKCVVFLLCGLLGVAQCVLREWTASDYPNPQDDPKACGRYESSFVCDPNKLISKKSGIVITILSISIFINRNR